MTKKQLIAQLKLLAVQQSSTALEIGKVCDALKDELSYVDLSELSGISVRTLRYMVDVWLFVSSNKIDHDAALQVGWTKMMLLSKYVEPNEIGAWMLKAQSLSVTNLKAALVGDMGVYTVGVFRWERGQEALFTATLLRYGANRRGSGLANKEAAMLRILRRLEELEDLTPRQCVA